MTFWSFAKVLLKNRSFEAIQKSLFSRNIPKFRAFLKFITATYCGISGKQKVPHSRNRVTSDHTIVVPRVYYRKVLAFVKVLYSLLFSTPPFTKVVSGETCTINVDQCLQPQKLSLKFPSNKVFKSEFRQKLTRDRLCVKF